VASKRKGSAASRPPKKKHLPTKPSPSSSKPCEIVVRSDRGEVIDRMDFDAGDTWWVSSWYRHKYLTVYDKSGKRVDYMVWRDGATVAVE
jgi:hypothetical protein